MDKRQTPEDLEQIRLSLYACSDQDKKESLYKRYLQSLRKLAYSGNSEAQYSLAQHYENMGVMGYPNPFESLSKRFYWYTKAANNNHAAANNNLADMYERGEGCDRNIKKALELYKKSASLGDASGKKNYKLLLRQIRSGVYDLDQ